jgi:hypothetical protein
MGLALVVITSCKEEFYTINDSFYSDKTVVLKNELMGDTLFIEQDNTTDQIMLEEPNHPEIVFDNRGFVFTVHDESIVTVAEDGAITPVSQGLTPLDIVSRADKNLKLSIFVKVYKEYFPVDSIGVSSKLSSMVIEKDIPYDLSKDVFVLPLSAFNKKLHFSIADASKEYAVVTDEGVITGLKATGSRNKAEVIVVSDENPAITASFKIQVVDEIIITKVNLLAGLDGAEISKGEVIDLNLCTSVEPANVREENKKLTFELLEGTGVLELDETGVIRAVGVGTARLKAKAKEQNGRQVFTEFTITVKEGLTDLTRLLWTVTTSLDYGYAPDGTTGLPQDMFDNNGATYFAVAKPGKTYNDCSTPADHIPYFIVDMKSVQKFNYIRWNHRAGNGNDYLRVWGIDFAGSDDGETFTDIQKEITIPIESNTTAYHIPVPVSEYRYVKVMLTKWSDNSGGKTDGITMQVAEFGLGFE